MICVFIGIVQNAESQHPYERVWVLGEGKSTTPGNLRVNNLEFTNDGLIITEDSSGSNISMRYTNTSFCNDSGQLLLASNGYHIIGSNRETIQNGNRLVESWSTNNWSFYGLGYPQGILLLDHESSYQLYHMLVMSSDFWEEVPGFEVFPKLYIVTIDCREDECIVVEKNKLFHDEILDHYIQATRHKNNKDWWIISRAIMSNKHFTYLLDSSGFSFVNEQQIGIPQQDSLIGFPSIRFSPNGKLFSRFTPFDGLEVFDFERETGLLSNFRHFRIPNYIYWNWGSVEFSPSGRYLYFSDPTQLYQMDLESEDWEASIILIDEFDNFDDGWPWPALFSELKRTPDCRIFLSSCQGTKYIHVIQEPDKPGRECRFEQRAIELPGLQYAGLPNHPNFSLGTPWEHYCDSIRTSTTEPIYESDISVKVWPNPASHIVSYSWETAGAFRQAYLYDMNGRLVASKDVTGTSQSSFWLTDCAPGLYILELQSREGELIRQKVIKQ